MQNIYSSSCFLRMVALHGILYFADYAQAQTTPVPPPDAALSTWQTFRGSNERHAQQLRRGGFTAATPVFKWEIFDPTPPGNNGGGEGEPVIGDIDGNGTNEVVAAFKQRVHGINSTSGTLIWSYTTGAQINGSPVIADVNSNGAMDVVVCSDKVYALNGSNGTVIWNFTPAPVDDFNSSPAVGDVVLGGTPEVIVTCDNGKVYCLNGTTGAQIWSYTVINTNENFWASPVIGDVNLDGQPDVVVVSPAAFNNTGGQVIALNGNNGTVIWTYTNPAFGWDIIPQSPVICDVNQDCQIDVLAPQDGDLYNIRGSNGTLQWSINGAGSGTPAVADIDGNCTLEIITGGPRAYNANGILIWSVAGGTSGWNAPAPRVGDFNLTSPGLEIVVGKAYDTTQTGTNYLVKMYSSTGTLLWGYKNQGHTTEGIAVGDIDNDGCVEIVINPDCCNGRSSVLAIDDVSGATNCGVSLSPSGAAFSASDTIICLNACINFTNLSSGCATGWAWTFNGGSPASSTSQNPFNICYNTIGTYTATLVATFGNCSPVMNDSATLVITVQNCGNVSVATTGANLCAGNCATISANVTGGTSPFTYSWNPSGQTTSSIVVCPTSTTTYSVLITDAAANTATDTAVVTVNSSPVATVTSPTTICASSSYTLTAGGGGTYSWSTGATTSSITVTPSSSTNYSVIVSNGSGCTDTATTTITVTPMINPTVTPQVICSGDSAVITASGGNTYSWSTGNTTSSITVSPTSTTSYTVLVTAGSCTATAVATVTVTTSITAVVNGNTTICSGNSTTLTASGGTTFSWSTGATSASITITPTTSGSYTVIVSSGTCADTTSINVTVNPLPTAVISPNTTICAGNSATLTASGGTSFSWSNGSMFPSQTVNPGSTTGYTVTITDANGCTDTASTTIFVNTGPTASVNGNTLLCTGDATTLNASGGNSYSWNTGATSASINVTPSSTTTYTVIATNTSGCSDTTSITVAVSPPPVANISGNDTICAGNNTVLIASGGGSYSWNTTPVQTTSSVNVSTAGNYLVVVSIGSCTDTASFNVVVVSGPTATAASSIVINIGDNTTLTATGGGTYSWAPSTGLSDPNISNPVASPQQTTDYCVYASDANGCMDSACVTITVEINCKPVYVPNAFSPNGDNENDVFYVYGNCIEEMMLIIYNRWGEKVYEGIDPAKGWDGIFGGKDENSAVFTYYLTYRLINGEKGNKKGNISLIR